MYLEKINSPEDIKKLTIDKLDILAEEIRRFLVESVSHTGGHLASNLGIVDLTIAMHYCFSCPRDKFVWDVGHQSYTHKILTGRKDEFQTLRKLDGLSGFPKTNESRYDSFNTGHSSTSIAAGIGLAKARDLMGHTYNVVSVIGDGAMTGGLAYEALNNVGRDHTKLIIILNDNQMSISENVGAMSKYLSELILTQKYMNAKSGIQKSLKNMPVGGEQIYNLLYRSKGTLKNAIMPENSMFEHLGIKYVGPIDGHNIKKMVNVLNKAKKLNIPVLIHVMTKKGKGYEPAEKLPSVYHGVGSFDAKIGVVADYGKKETYSDVFSRKMLELAAGNKKICAITAAMPSGTGLAKFANMYPKRFFDVGIAEEYAVTFGAGLAKGGFIPVFAVYSTFLQRSYDQILHDVCIQNLHVVFAIDRAGIVGNDGETHQGIYDISYLSHIPNLTVMAPKNKIEFERMLEYAIELKGPVALRYPRGEASEIMVAKCKEIEYGKAEYIYTGEKIALISYGAMMDEAADVYSELIERGYNPTLINARFVSPMDSDMVKDMADNYKYIFTLEDNIHSGGFGACFSQKICEYGINNNVIHNFAFPDMYIEHGSRELLFDRYGMSAEKITKKIVEIIGENKNG
ncbi:MAG: 1-deoxy-D-xylulose-5-phosphate synthase [Clostridia bacterium]|nr:1-deoxy-D-xylulose-5-phosphate synthase [Clostridia bacterium]